MKKRIRYLLTIICVAMAFIGVLLWLNLPSNVLVGKDVTLTIHGNTTTTLKAELTELYPGKTESYTINLVGDDAGESYISLAFRKGGDDALKDYITVTVKTQETTTISSLKDLLNGKSISLGQNVQSINILYNMPEDVGNEAQGASASFYIDLTASDRR